MKKIAIFTTTRADFGILSPLITALNNETTIEVLLFVGGTHLAKEHGYTLQEIQKKGFKINQTLDFLLNDTSAYSLVKSLSIETFELANIFEQFHFDAVCVLGDRFELLPIVQTAILYKKILIHIHGGESTEGAFDEQIRHMITKAAHIHFASCEKYAQNIIKLGENKLNVYNTGALAVDNMSKQKRQEKKILFENLGLNPNKQTVIMTYHPVTLESELSPQTQIENVFIALDKYDLQLVITSPNTDTERDSILNIILEKVSLNQNYVYIESLGVENFHNLIYYTEFVIGNSSSGIIEVPFFKKPTVNIGIRQKGRIQHLSIINTSYDIESIQKGIDKACDLSFKKQLETMPYLFGDGNTAKRMLSIIKKISFDKKLLRKKLIFT